MCILYVATDFSSKVAESMGILAITPILLLRINIAVFRFHNLYLNIGLFFFVVGVSHSVMFHITHFYPRANKTMWI